MQKGDVITSVRIIDDNWYYGVVQRTGAKGP